MGWYLLVRGVGKLLVNLDSSSHSELAFLCFWPLPPARPPIAASSLTVAGGGMIIGACLLRVADLQSLKERFKNMFSTWCPHAHSRVPSLSSALDFSLLSRLDGHEGKVMDCSLGGNNGNNFSGLRSTSESSKSRKFPSTLVVSAGYDRTLKIWKS